MFKKSVFIAVALFAAAGPPTALASDDCWTQCMQSCLKFGNSDWHCGTYCAGQVCSAS